MIEFLSRSDMTDTNPGRQVHVYIGRVDGERKYLPRQYLLWTLRDLLDIINGTESNFVSTFSEKLTFSQPYEFTKTHKQFIYKKVIRYTSTSTSKEKTKTGYNAPDCVSNGTMSSVFIIEFRSLFVLVYSFFSFLF